MKSIERPAEIHPEIGSLNIIGVESDDEGVVLQVEHEGTIELLHVTPAEALRIANGL